MPDIPRIRPVGIDGGQQVEIEWHGAEGAAQVQNAQGRKSASAATGRDRRVADRFDLNNAEGHIIHKGVKIPCQVIDISLTGCCVRIAESFSAGALESVRVVVPIYEIVLSIWGVTQWVRGDRLLGVQFVHPNARSKNQLAALLTCLLDNGAADVVRKAVAVAAIAQGDGPIIALQHPEAVYAELQNLDDEQADLEMDGYEAIPDVTMPPAPSPRPTLRSEHKILNLEDGESPATLQLLGDELPFAGEVLGLSQDGCMVRLRRPCPLRMNVLAEVDFCMRGLPFRLPGTTTEMHDPRTVEIRFTEMSRRKREDLAQVIEELIKAGESKRKAS